MANFNPPFGDTSRKRWPTEDERKNGFPCGPADQSLFNGMFYRIEAELRTVIMNAGITPSDSSFTQLYDAIKQLISAATGSGDQSNFVLMANAMKNLPFYPEIKTPTKTIEPAVSTGKVIAPGGVSILWRGIAQLSTTETPFSVAANKTYHLRWTDTWGYTLYDLADPKYNPNNLNEANSAFDSRYDSMLVARIITNSQNAPSVTPLMNAPKLTANEILVGTHIQRRRLHAASAYMSWTLNWARQPRTISNSIVFLNWWMDNSQNPSDPNDHDNAIFAIGTEADRTSEGWWNNQPVGTRHNRYKVDYIRMYDGMYDIQDKFSAEA